MIQKLGQMLKEQKEFSTALREENRQQSSKQGQASENDDVYTDGGTLDYSTRW